MIELLNEDCMITMARYPDKYFDLAIVDPPYGIGAGEMTMGSGKHKFKKGKDWDRKTPDEDYFNELFRVTKEQIIWGGNYFVNFLPINNNWIVWDKLNPNLSFSEAELAWCSINKNIRVFKHYSANVEEQGKIHPTQKSVKLYRWIYTKYLVGSGDKILDTHLGSGSSAIAAHQFGIAEFTGSEIDKDYYDAAVKRFNLVTSQTQLF